MLDPLSELDQAQSAGRLSSEAAERVRLWLTDPAFAGHRQQVVEHIAAGSFRELDDAFWKVLPFGTGGRRGRMYPIGSNAINTRTIGESAQGLADYLRRTLGATARLSAAVAHDTRHSSREFARLTACVLAANGFHVYFFPEHRSTPQLSFAVRHLDCTTGVVISASHNPPTDNGFKCYWSNGGQVLPPHDEGIIQCVEAVREVRALDFDDAVRAGRIAILRAEHDDAYVRAVCRQALGTCRDLRIVFTPLHGVGATNVGRVLAAAGFRDVHTVPLQAIPDGSFPHVAQHTPNPEQPAALREAIALAREVGADLVIASDPDADRIGAAAPRPGSNEWVPFTGNQIAALLTSFVCGKLKVEVGERPLIIKTLVTTNLMARIAAAHGVDVRGNLLVGFKWIARVMDERPNDRFLFGAEESHGYLAGRYSRDKDGAVAALLLAELAAEQKAAGHSLPDYLDGLYRRHGYHAEGQLNRTLEGRAGVEQMQRLMAAFRREPPRHLGGLAALRLHDYLGHETRSIAAPGAPEPLPEPDGDMVELELEPPRRGTAAPTGWRVVVRPSGTEPKIKFYLFGYEPPEQLNGPGQLASVKTAVDELFRRIAADLDAYVASAVRT
jgi:phosphoglucomutase/phosphomannomutase